MNAAEIIPLVPEADSAVGGKGLASFPSLRTLSLLDLSTVKREADNATSCKRRIV